VIHFLIRYSVDTPCATAHYIFLPFMPYNKALGILYASGKDTSMAAGSLDTIIRQVEIAAARVILKGDLVIPPGAEAIVLFAHGSGSGRHSPRNRAVAEVLSDSGLATFLFDLLAAEEEADDTPTGQYRFNVPLLAERMIKATDWIRQEPSVQHLHIGYFGASTGAAATLVAASQRDDIGAIVSRGGRPDLAGDALSKVKAPTRLIVGANDTFVIKLNEDALKQIPADKELKIIPGAGHLFEEKGALEKVALLASEWFDLHLR
jgi:putative phosphoribosyl transferase